MTDETKKRSFADRFKKGDGFKGTSSPGGRSFVSRFRPNKNEEDNNSDDESGGKFAKIRKEAPQKQPFSVKKGLKNKSTEGMSKTEQIRRRRSQNVFLVRGKDRDRSAWHYVLVDNNKRELFLAATRRGSLDVADYGEVLESGWGQDPPEEVVKRIEDEFNL